MLRVTSSGHLARDKSRAEKFENLPALILKIYKMCYYFTKCVVSYLPVNKQQFLYFLPEPHGQLSLRPILG